MDIPKLDNGKLQKALETSGTHMAEIKDDTHGHLFIEIIQRKIPCYGNKWFVGCFTPQAPNEHVGNFDKVLFGKTLQASWEQYASAVTNKEELETEQEPIPAQPTQPAVPPTPSPSQPQPNTTPATRAVSPSAASPKQLKEDND